MKLAANFDAAGLATVLWGSGQVAGKHAKVTYALLPYVRTRVKEFNYQELAMLLVGLGKLDAPEDGPLFSSLLTNFMAASEQHPRQIANVIHALAGLPSNSTEQWLGQLLSSFLSVLPSAEAQHVA